jgi:8-oxo-dGTP pyrophosphatase MutT (NUDIX family)
VNSQREVLVVKESGRNYVPWKIPGGLSELGENIEEAALREVMEETGIQCQFHSILGVRHTHNIQFGRSDLYFICRLSPVISATTTNSQQQQPKPQPGEIQATQWLPLEEFKDMIQTHNHPMMKLILQLYEQGETQNHLYDIQTTWVDSIVPGRLPSPVYHAPLVNSSSNRNDKANNTTIDMTKGGY